MLPIIIGIFVVFAAYIINDYLKGQQFYALNSSLRSREPSYLKWWLRHDWLELTLFGMYTIVLVYILVGAEIPSLLRKINFRIVRRNVFYVQLALLAYIAYDFFVARLFYKRELESKSLADLPFRSWWFRQNGLRLGIAFALLVVLIPFVYSIF